MKILKKIILPLTLALSLTATGFSASHSNTANVFSQLGIQNQSNDTFTLSGLGVCTNGYTFPSQILPGDFAKNLITPNKTPLPVPGTCEASYTNANGNWFDLYLTVEAIHRTENVTNEIGAGVPQAAVAPTGFVIQ